MKLTIGQRILLGLGVVVVLALGLGAYMLYTLARLRGIETRLKERDLQILETLNGIIQKQGETRALRERAVARFLLARANLPKGVFEALEDPVQLRQRWRKSQRELSQLLTPLKNLATEYGQTALSPERQHQWERIARTIEESETARQSLQETAEKTFDLLTQQNFGQLAPAIQTVAGHRRAFDEKLNAGVELTKRQNDIGVELAAATYREAWVSVLGGLALMLALGLVSGLVVRRSVTRPLGQFVLFVEQVGRGDLTVVAPQSSVTDLEQLGQSMDRMVVGLKDLTGQTIAASRNLSSAAQEILASVQQMAAGTRQQAAAVQEITTTIEEISQSGGQISERARQVATTGEATASSTTVGLNAVQAATRSMEAIREQVETFAEHIVSLSEKTQTVGETVAAVTDLAERANLLALNAAIEAAGAGEYGLRFAVVASEMKNLADQAREATVQVQGILGSIQKGINSSVMLTEEAVKRADAGKSQAETTQRVIQQNVSTTQESIQAFQQIIAATNQQQIGLDQVGQGMKDIRQAAGETALATTQLETAVANLSALSRQLEGAVGRYRI